MKNRGLERNALETNEIATLPYHSGDKVPVMGAARANGYIGDLQEFNDLLMGVAG